MFKGSVTLATCSKPYANSVHFPTGKTPPSPGNDGWQALMGVFQAWQICEWFLQALAKPYPMRVSTVLLALIVLFTFPVWIGLIAGGFGILIGIIGAMFGAVFGLVGAVFGAIGAVLEALFDGIFGWGHHWNFIGFPHFRLNGFGLAVLVIIIALVWGRPANRKDEGAG